MNDDFFQIIMCGLMVGGLSSIAIVEILTKPYIRESVVNYCNEKPRQCKEEYLHNKLIENNTRTIRNYKRPEI